MERYREQLSGRERERRSSYFKKDFFIRVTLYISLFHMIVVTGRTSGVYFVHFDHLPAPSFDINFFPLTNKFAAGGTNFFEFITQKDESFRPFTSS